VLEGNARVYLLVVERRIQQTTVDNNHHHHGQCYRRNGPKDTMNLVTIARAGAFWWVGKCQWSFTVIVLYAQAYPVELAGGVGASPVSLHSVGGGRSFFLLSLSISISLSVSLVSLSLSFLSLSLSLSS
jgi:hypothetical protein